MRKGHIKLQWPENSIKQGYDKKITNKIQFTENPFIKPLETKKKYSEKQFWKIGEIENASRIKNEKHVDIKIGHLDGEYALKKKTREDGCFAGTKNFEYGPSKTSTQIIF